MTNSDKPTATVGRGDDGTMYIICHDGAAASFYDDAWHPGIPWSGRTLCDYRGVSPDDVARCIREAKEALRKSLPC